MFNWHNCPANVAHQLEVVTCICQQYMSSDLVGLYLHGSLAMGCFTPGRSDIDLLLVSREPLTRRFKRQLAETLLRNSNRPSPIEISALTLADLHPWVYPTHYDFHYSETWREQTARGLADKNWPAAASPRLTDPDLAAHVTVTRSRGVCLVGQPAEDVFPEVPRSDYLDSILKDFEWGKDRLNENPVYFVLNTCRILAYLAEGQVLSKLEGGEWGVKYLPEGYRPMAQAAANAYGQGQDWRDPDAYPLKAFTAWAEQEIKSQFGRSRS